jgi:hypothetical protein
MVVCDYLSVSVPVESAPRFRAELIAFLSGEGFTPARTDGTFVAPPPASGTAKVVNRGPVLAVGISGSALAFLRDSGAFPGLLEVLASVPHRVTRLDAALDVPTDAPPVLRDLRARAMSGRMAFGKRRLAVADVGLWQRPAVYDQSIFTGTLYLGRRGADRQVRVYDKRNEVLDRTGADPGPLVRYEITFGKGGRTGVSLRDAEDPTALFWSVAGGVLLPRPLGVPDWVPAGESFELPPAAQVDPLSRLAVAVDRSGGLAALVRLAADCGPSQDPLRDPPGLEVLLQGVRRAYRQAAQQGPAGR